MIIICKSSIELSDNEWIEITDSFKSNFSNDINWQNFKRYFLNSYLGYAYHSLVLNEQGRIVGHTAFIPKYYYWQGEKVLMAQSGSTFIDKEYRTDLLLYRKLYDALKIYVSEKGVQFILIVPNKAAYTYTERILKAKNISPLDYYIFPSTGFYSRGGSLLGMIFWPLKMVHAVVFSAVLKLIGCWLKLVPNKNSISEQLQIFRGNDFEKSRYYNERDYVGVQHKELKYFLNTKTEKGIKTAYLMHFEYKGRQDFTALEKAISHMLFSKNAPELIVMIGYYEWLMGSIFKLPMKYQPQKFPLMIDTMNLPKEKIEFLLERENWKFSLENFDVR
jgi:hypothetical protein